ncbi:MAG: efflux transporter outer membrane subunit [Desulfobulbus sp.]|nr:efflux transporter outer membrane subunit [Desulfobulbus sp.]
MKAQAVYVGGSALCGRANRRQHATCWLMLVLFFALSGCGSMAPSYKQPPLPVAPLYPGAPSVLPASSGQRAIATGWREYFTDQRLRRLINQALNNNRDLRLATLRVEEARATYGIQRADQFPSIGVGADAARSRVPGDLNTTGQSVVGSQYQAGLNLNSWELDFWGRVRSLKDAALENYLASDAARRAVTVSLISQVANGYLRLRELDERLMLARQTIASHTESLRIFQRRVEVGSTSQLDLTQVETLLQQAQALGAQLEQDRAFQANGLVLLVGQPVDFGPVATSFDDAEVLRIVRVGLPSELLIQRPDIVAAEHQLKAAHANIGAARAAFFPRIALTGSFGTASSELANLFGAGSRAWTFASNLSLPIFDGGRNWSNLDLAEVRRDQAVAVYERSIQSAFRDVADALAAQKGLTRQVQVLQATLAVQTKRAHLAKLRYDNGAAAFLEVLDAQRNLLDATQQLAQTRRALLSSRVDLYAALGGGA